MLEQDTYMSLAVPMLLGLFFLSHSSDVAIQHLLQQDVTLNIECVISWLHLTEDRQIKKSRERGLIARSGGQSHEHWYCAEDGYERQHVRIRNPKEDLCRSSASMATGYVGR